MKKRIIISAVLTFVSVVLCCYMLFAEIPEYEYFLAIEAISVLLFAISLVTLMFSVILKKTEQSAGAKKVYKIIVLFLIIITVLYIPIAFISCYDEYTPEKFYVDNKEYIQQYLPVSDVNEIETRDDMLRSLIMYTNYPGFSEFSVVDRQGFDRYYLIYTKSLNPVYNLRAVLNIKLILITESINEEWTESIYSIDGTKVFIYSNSNDRLGYIKNYGRIIMIHTEDCNDMFVTESDFAKYICEQYKLSDECVTSKCFRDAPWYDIPFYVKALSEPYE